MPARYVFRAGLWRDPYTGEPMDLPSGDEPCVPRYVISDLQEYRSPIDGRPITSRMHQREDLKRNDCVLAEPRKPRGYRNPEFARKRGLKLRDEA